MGWVQSPGGARIKATFASNNASNLTLNLYFSISKFHLKPRPFPFFHLKTHFKIIQVAQKQILSKENVNLSQNSSFKIGKSALKKINVRF